MDAATIVAEWGDMKNERSREESDWRALETYLSPEREEMREGLDNPIVVDGTGYNALENFAGGLFGTLTNPANQWISFRTEDDDLNRWHKVKTWLETTTRITLRSLGSETSSFYRSIGEFFMDEAQYGNGWMYSEIQPEKQRFLDVCRPLAEMYCKLDAEGDLDIVVREFKATYRQAKGIFGDDMPAGMQEETSGVEAQHTFLHCVYPNPSKKDGRVGAEGMDWNSQYVWVEKSVPCGPVRGYHEMPYDFGRWSRRSGRAYGKGPGHKALPDLRMLSQMGIDLIDLANYVARPPILLADEESLSVGKIYPNSAVYGGIDERTGRQLADYLINKGNLPITLEMLRETRTMVKDTFMWSLMQMVGRTGMTATEVLEIQEERMRLMGPHLARQQTEVLSPFVTRRFRQLSREGLLPPPPDELKKRKLEIFYESPMARAQKVAEATATMRFVDGIGRVAAIGKQAVIDNIDEDEIAAVLQEGFGAPSRVIRGREKVAELRASREQMDQASQALGAGDQLASIAQKVSQAASSQGGRPVGS